MTPLRYAVMKGHDKVVEVLLANGATMDYSDTDGRSPLFRSCARGNLRVVMLLLQAKKKQCKQKGLANCRTLIDEKTLVWAANYQGREESVQSSARLILDT